MPTGLGHRSYIQIGKETTYAVGVAAAFRFEVISMSIEPVIGMIEDPSLYNGVSRRGLFQGGILYRGKFRVRANYEGIEEAMRMVWGSYAATTVETGVRDHTFKELVGQLPSYTIQMIEGDISTGLCQRLLGAVGTSFEFGMTAGQGNDGMGYFEFEVLAKDKQVDQAITALTAPAVFPVLFHQHTAAFADGATTPAQLVTKEVTIKMENKVTDDRFGMVGGVAGSPNILQPLRNNFLDVTWTFRNEFATVELLNAARAFTNGAPKVFFQHPTTIGVASKREFELRSNTAKLSGYSNPIDNYGVVEATATWRASLDGTDTTALLARARNTMIALV